MIKKINACTICGAPVAVFAVVISWVIMLCAFHAPYAVAQTPTSGLTISPDDVLIDERVENGFLLTVKKSGNINSILITESTRNSSLAGPAYTFWTPNYRAINGDERRVLDGQFLTPSDRYYLVDSTPEIDDTFGEVFRIFIPYTVHYGFPWSREGTVNAQDGTFINIRAFSLQHADYRGDFKDNPFLIRIVQAERADALTGTFIPQTITDLSDISQQTDGLAYQASDGEMATAVIDDLLNTLPTEDLDIVFVVDTTRSMRNDITQIKTMLPTVLAKYEDTFPALNIGLVLYRDYNDEYLTLAANPIATSKQFVADLQAAQVSGGRDEPEAVYEALFTALNSFDWQATQRLIVLVGDAPPHPQPRGSVTPEAVLALTATLGVNIHSIILPR